MDAAKRGARVEIVVPGKHIDQSAVRRLRANIGRR